MNQQDKLALVAQLEKAGIVQRTVISSLRSDCPFCFASGSFHIILHTNKNSARYACGVCGEIGTLVELKQNLKESARPEKITVRQKHTVKSFSTEIEEA